MKRPLPEIKTGRTWHVYTSTDRKEWNLTTATRSSHVLRKLVPTMRHNGKYVAIVLSTARLQKVLKPLNPPTPHPAPRKPARPAKAAKPARQKPWRDTLVEAQRTAHHDAAA